MTESFIFSQLNYNGDDNAPSKKRRSQLKKTPAGIELNAHDAPIFSRPVTMRILVPQECVLKPGFNPAKYLLTPRGYINRSIFSNNIPLELESVHYLASFSMAFVRDARLVISESECVVDFVLNSLALIPCNVPLRWGVLYNLKFRRVFQCLTLDKWSALLECLKKYSYAIIVKGSVHFVDPSLDAPEQINLPESQYLHLFHESQVSATSQEPAEDHPRPKPAIPAFPRIDPFKTPERGANNSNVHSFLFQSPPSTPAASTATPEATTPVPRARNDSIYAMHLSNSISPALADRFNPTLFPGDLVTSIRRLYCFSDAAIEIVYKTLRELPVSIPLRWGCIYNKHLRVRSKLAASNDAGTTLLQWKQLRDLLIRYGYLDDRTVANPGTPNDLMPKLLPSLLFLLFSLLAQSSHQADWPLPTVLHMRSRRTSAYRRSHEQPLAPVVQPDFQLFDYLAANIRPFIGLPRLPSTDDVDSCSSSAGSSTELEESLDHTRCDICFHVVPVSDFLPCCTNGHTIHFNCFKTILEINDPARHRCPMCRNGLIAQPQQLHTELQRGHPSNYWAVLEGHFRVLFAAKPLEMARLNWQDALLNVITKGKPAHLRHFLALADLIDVNFTFSNQECAISTLLLGIALYKSEEHRVKRLKDNLDILVEHPQIQLNRMSGILPRHLIYYAVDSGHFPVFPVFLHSAPGLNLPELLRYICYQPDHEARRFFDYLLASEPFDLFRTDEFNLSALHIAVKVGNSEFILKLLQSPKCSVHDLMTFDTRTGSTVLHTAMKTCDDVVLDKLLKFPGIDWDRVDFFGQSIGTLFDYRSFS